jgi:NAD(P)-dependent dehydrogenase (short-subunit alcohol dehydrogenase family)
MTSNGLAGRVALVTGARRGIGRAIVTALLDQGVRVAVNARDAAGAERAAAALGPDAMPAPGDVTRAVEVRAMVAEVLARSSTSKRRNGAGPWTST